MITCCVTLNSSSDLVEFSPPDIVVICDEFDDFELNHQVV